MELCRDSAVRVMRDFFEKKQGRACMSERARSANAILAMLKDMHCRY